ncbi:unnamed protein product [Caenorhabditis brenneri]
MPFNFLGFPFPVMKNLVDQMSPVDLVRVSLQNVYADNALKACGKQNVSFFNLHYSEIHNLGEFDQLELLLQECRRQGRLPEWNFELRCNVVYCLYISISCRYYTVRLYFENLEDIEKFAGIRRNLKVGESLVPVVLTKEGSHGMMAFIDYLKNSFNLSNIELVFDGNDPTAVRTVVNHISSTQTLVRKIEVGYGPRLSDDDFKFIVQNVTATECFTSQLGLSKHFKFNGTICNLLISNEKEDIFVDGSNYTTEDLRKFLKEWQSGKFPKLKLVRLNTNVTWRNYLDVTKGFERRIDKCDYSNRKRPVVAIKGQGDFYCIINPDNNSHGCFHMSVHND